ncbi:DUF4974 domain-containing protein [Halosquirtibacter laminarini]|uniref:DUF4974 domain-containing protein n=1 Tax=Halosquirtibacter laminarini TaxID=3374600 RepID=A0AC61NFB2_9BACT|nr:DUF4974 domain-containing protein [Prolixibacteraceae bacterium]
MILEETIIKYCNGQCTNEEKEAIEERLESDSSLREQVFEIRKIIELERDIAECRSYDVEGAFHKLPIKQKKTDRVLILTRSMLKYAAMFILPFVMGLFVMYYAKNITSRDVGSTEIYAPIGARLKYELPDKSTVYLNSGSRLSFSTNFNHGKRKVKLKGEGYFEVTANKRSPFYVETEDGSSVYVYGTKFNVSAYSDDSFVETVLVEGCVNYESKSGKTIAKLKPGHRLVYNKLNHNVDIEKTNVEEKTGWRRGKFIFRNKPLSEITKMLSRYYNIDILIDSSVKQDYLFRATFRQENIYQILDYLSLSAPIQWLNIESKPIDSTDFRKRIIIKHK